MRLKELLESQVVRVYENGVPCLKTANVEDYEVLGVQGYLDKATRRLMIDIDIARPNTYKNNNE